jgi:hypothetical protein
MTYLGVQDAGGLYEGLVEANVDLDFGLCIYIYMCVCVGVGMVVM